MKFTHWRARPVPLNPPCGSAGPAFAGDLAVTTAYNNHSTFLTFYDITDLAKPCDIGGKTLTWNPETPPTEIGAYPAVATAQGIATLHSPTGPVAFAAVSEFALMGVDVGQQIPDRPNLQSDPNRPAREGTFPGNYTDVIAVADRLVAIERTMKKLDVFDANFSHLASLDLPDIPRRLVVADDWPIDFNGDGKIQPTEVRRVAFVGGHTRIQFVDITDLASPRLLGHVAMPTSTIVPGTTLAVTRELDADPGPLRLYAGSATPSGGDALYVIDASDLRQAGPIDFDQDPLQWDDRILWSLPYPKGIGGVKVDGGRGLLYVAAPEGLDIISLADRCCDIGVDFTAPRVDQAPGPVDELIVAERQALQKGIENGLADAAAECTGIESRLVSNKIWILEQGSGACVWRGQCSSNYQPGVSDHDFEVFFPEALLQGNALQLAYCTTRRLTAAFREEIAVGNRTFRFNDVTFYPLEAEAFANASLYIEPIPGDGNDSTGDMGLGRQQLLLGKFLLEGEYVDLSTFNVRGPSIAELLDKLLRRGWGLPAVEGYEWATLQRYGLIKSKAFVRIKGASAQTSAFHEFYVQQLHGAGKAGIRAAMARMVADHTANQMIREFAYRYWFNACLRASNAPLHEWVEKPCDSFEEFVASMAARDHIRNAALNRPPIFTHDRVLDIQRFYQVKADLYTMPTEQAADEFVTTVAQFIEAVVAATQPIYNQLIADDPDVAQRTQNLNKAQAKTASALAEVSLHVVPRVFNIGFRDASQVKLQMWRINDVDAPGTGSEIAAPLALDVQAASEQFLRDRLSPRVNPEEDITDNEQNLTGHRNLSRSDREPYFKLPIDLNAGFGEARAVAFSIDLPDRTVREPNRRNNIGGFFYYVLDRTQDPAAVTVPATPPTVPVPGNWTPPVLEPDNQCTDAPGLTILQSMLGSLARLTFTNTSQETLKNIGYCADITTACVSNAIASLAPGASITIDIPITMPGQATVLESRITVYAFDGDGRSVPPVTSRAILVTSSPFKITMFDASPLAELDHPFSRFQITRLPGSVTPRPIFGAVTDGESRSIRIAIEGLSPGSADLSIADAEVHSAVDGIGGLTAANGSAVPAVQLQVSVDAAGRAEAFYTPPSYFIRPVHQNRDFDRAERHVTLTVTQNAMSTPARIALRRPPVFLVHGLWGHIGVWDDLQPLVPKSDARYFRSRPGFGGWYDLFNVGSPHASHRLEVEKKDVVEQIWFSLENYLPGFAIGKIDLLAHSMGGMISRKMINENAAIRAAVRKLIILNSPLRGSPLADKVVETRDSYKGLLDSLPSPIDLWNPSPPDAVQPVVQEGARNTLCYTTLQSLGRAAILNIFNGAIDDLQTAVTQPNGQPTEVGNLIAHGNKAPTHLFVTTTTGADLGYSGEVTALWSMLGIFCNWTPDTNTVPKTELVKIGAKAVGEIGKALVFRGGRSANQMNGLLSGVRLSPVGLSDGNDGPPIPIFGSAANDRIVPQLSQLEGLPESSPWVTSVFGDTDHQDIKNTGVPVDVCVETVNGVKRIKTPVPVGDIDNDGQPDAVCHIVDMLERDPKDPKFRQ